MNSLLRSKGFALPAVLISSVVMMSVLLVSLTSISSTAKSIQLQYEDKLLEDTVEAGLAYANACLDKDGGNANWTYLYPGSTCNNEQQCTIDASATCWLYDDETFRTTFEVSATNFDTNGAATIYVTAKSVKVRTSSGDAAVEQSNVAKARLQRSSTEIPLSTGTGHACAIAFDNNAYCWGGGREICDVDPVTFEFIYCNSPVLGNGTSDTSSSPVAVTRTGALAGRTVVALSASGNRACVLASDYKAYCWGKGIEAASTSTASPVAAGQTGPLASMTLKAIEPGNTHTCAIASDDKAYCWGANNGGNSSGSKGKLGINTDTAIWTATPQEVVRSGALAGKTFRQISVGSNHTCVIASDDKAYCWGDNSYDQLGDGTATSRWVPTPVKDDGALAGKTIRQISAGELATCVIASDSKAYCWGSNSTGAVGSGNAQSFYNAPVAVSGGYSFSSISMGRGAACGITTDNKAYCWGRGTSGQLGNGSTSNSNVPVQVTGLPSGVALTSIAQPTDNSTCAVASDSRIYCWGDNTNGQLGNGTTTASLTPVAVGAPFNTPPPSKFYIY